MPLVRALVLGALQGLTEFLPVSSSAHLELVPWLAGWEHFGDDEATAALREQAFDVALHVGTLIGAVAFLRHDIARYATAAWSATRRWAARWLRPSASSAQVAGAEQRDAQIGFGLVLAAAPAGLVALVLEDVLLDAAEQPLLIAITLATFGWLLFAAHRLGPSTRRAGAFSPADAAMLGTAQAFALVPGVSRSGAIITAARLGGFEIAAAARLAFLMALPVIAGAASYRALDVIGGEVPAADLAPMALGAAAAALTSFVSLWVLGAWLTQRRATRTFATTATYRTLLAAVVVLVLAAG